MPASVRPATPTPITPSDTTMGATATVGGPAVPTDLFDLLSTVPAAGNLDPDGLRYCEQLTEMIKPAGLQTKRLVLNRFEVLLVHNSQNDAIALMLEASKSITETAPTTDRAPEIIQQAALHGLQVISGMVVTQADYARLRQMASTLVRFLGPKNLEVANYFTAAAFSGKNLLVDGDVNAVRNYIAARWPHAVMPRIDCGFIMAVQRPSKTVSLSQVGRQEMDTTEIAAVGAYTDFTVEMVNLEMKFRPIITLSVIHSDWPSARLLGCILPLAADTLKNRQRYMSAFSFDVGPMNLGNLLLDQSTKAPLRIDNPMARDQFLNKFVLDPFIAINITDGQCRIPYLDTLLLPADVSRVGDAIGQFLKTTVNKAMMTAGVFPEYSGTVRIGEQVVDSHCVDYMYLVSCGKPQGELTQFLNKTTDPRERMAAIQQHVTSAQTLYVTRQAVLSGPFVGSIGPLLQESGFAARYVNMGSVLDGSLSAFLQPNAATIPANTFTFVGGINNPFAGYQLPNFGPGAGAPLIR